MNRRGFILALAAGTVAGLSGCAASPVPAGTTGTPNSKPGTPSTAADGRPSTGGTAGGSTSADATSADATSADATANPTPPSAPPITTSADHSPKSWPDEIITALPDGGPRLALTVDDGTSSAVVAAYAQFAKDTGARLTFFLNGVNDSWTDNAAALRPLVDAGQVQLANHTWDHADLRSLSDREISAELTRNDRFVRSTYGVTTMPYLRPPYGFHDHRTRRIATEEGYPTTVLWYGSLGDSQVLDEDQILANARQWIAAGRIVIGHANHPAVTHVYAQLVEIIRDRSLFLVTLNDAFLRGR